MFSSSLLISTACGSKWCIWKLFRNRWMRVFRYSAVLLYQPDSQKHPRINYWNGLYPHLLHGWTCRWDFCKCKFCCPKLDAAVLKLANTLIFFFLLRLWLTYNYFCHCVCFAASVLHDIFTLSHLVSVACSHSVFFTYCLLGWVIHVFFFFSGPYKFNLLLSLLFAFSSDVEVHSSLLHSNYYFWCIIFLQIRWLTLVDGEANFLRNLVCPYEAWFVIVKLVCCCCGCTNISRNISVQNLFNQVPCFW